MNTPPPITLAPTGLCELVPVPTVAELQSRVAELEARCEAAERPDDGAAYWRNRVLELKARYEGQLEDRYTEGYEAGHRVGHDKGWAEGHNAGWSSARQGYVEEWRLKNEEARLEAAEAKLHAVAEQASMLDLWDGDTLVERIGAIVAEVVA